MGKVH